MVDDGESKSGKREGLKKAPDAAGHKNRLQNHGGQVQDSSILVEGSVQ